MHVLNWNLSISSLIDLIVLFNTLSISGYLVSSSDIRSTVLPIL